MAESGGFTIIIPGDGRLPTNPEEALIFLADIVGLTLIGLPIGSWLESLFGGGHAGSCGAFRDSYFDSVRVTEPMAAQFNIDAARFIQAGPGTTLNHNAFVSNYLNFVRSQQLVIDNGFEKFKGSNLLGQTMFHSRYNGWLFREFIQPMLFHTNDWTWQWLMHQRALGVTLTNNIAGLTNQNRHQYDLITALQGQIGQIPAILSRLSGVEATVKVIRDTDLVKLRNDLTTLNNFTRLDLSPKVQQSINRLNSIEQSVIPSVTTFLNSLQSQITDVRKTYATKAELNLVKTQLLASITTHSAQISQLFTRVISLEQFRPAIQTQLQTLTNRVTVLEAQARTFATKLQVSDLQTQIDLIIKQQANFVIKPEFQAHLDSYNQTVNRLAAQGLLIGQHKQVLDGVVAQLPNFVTRPEFQAYQGQQQQLHAAMQQQLNDLRIVDQRLDQGIQSINDRILQEIIPQITQNTDRIGQQERQKTQVILPAIHELTNITVNIDQRITHEIEAPVVEITQTVINVFNTLRLHVVNNLIRMIDRVKRLPDDFKGEPRDDVTPGIIDADLSVIPHIPTTT